MLFAPVLGRVPHSDLRRADLAFERFVHGALNPPVAPSCRFAQDEQHFTLTLDLPGLAKEQLSVQIEGAQLRISSLPQAPRQVQLAYELPQEIEVSASHARLEHGVLTLVLAKRAAQLQATVLPIE